MVMIRITREGDLFVFGRKCKPLGYVDPGEEVIFDCKRKKADKVITKIDWTKVNPLTGPVFVNGAQPGDILKVVIRHIDLDESGVYTVVPGIGVLGDIVEEPSTKVVPVRRGRAVFSESLKLQLSPNIGTIGVAPAKGIASSGLPGDHGGNMDIKELRTGATLYLPVHVPGALFALGDLHICMGDGEICGSGGATGGRVSLSLYLAKGILKRPLVNAENKWVAIASAVTLDKAVKKASADMVSLLASTHKLSFNEAYVLASAACDLKICQAVNPLKTVGVIAPGSFFQEKLLFDFGRRRA
jgi:amidase